MARKNASSSFNEASTFGAGDFVKDKKSLPNEIGGLEPPGAFGSHHDMISAGSRQLEVIRWKARLDSFFSGHHQRAYCFCGERCRDLRKYRFARGFRSALAQGVRNRMARRCSACFFAIPYVRSATEAIVRLIEGQA